MNVSDTEIVTSILQENGYKMSAQIDEADILIFNTCSVRQHAEDRVLGRINNEMTRKTENPLLKIGVIGCMAQRLGTRLREKNRAIDFVVGTDQYRKLPEIIAQLYHNSCFRENIQINDKEVYEGFYPCHQGRFTAFVTIMRGCNNFCSYCIVPYTRGRERSRRPQEILSEIRKLGRSGYKDITLLGQNVNSYYHDNVDFPSLLKMIDKIDSIYRIRFITSHPKDLSDSLISTMASCGKVCEHIHLGMQSGDDEILRRMNRGYSGDQFLQLTRKLRKAIPDIAITTDVIAGFPGESEEQFQRTLDLMREVEFDYAFTFKFSPRSGTRAAELDGQLPEEICLARLQRLINLQEDITLKKYQYQIGKTKEIFVEHFSKKSEREVSGKSRDFKITVFPGSSDLLGKLVKVKITAASGWTLKGSAILG
ncbi:MAG: tRNA (N6-isopentenyl adenosine(37)-C2)-methylthiotransferase MiaB [Candidatus Cloacimonetes bacterium]|nr:tRNA (N6-isopentenyl adenosine(37)-C2)-methylthiotransferase MiaB [Candidatus Cloacimonadota bacterium]